jgi:hypothetical protein
MTTTTTPDMPVTVVYCSRNKIMLQVTTPAAPLYLSVLTVSWNSGVTGLVGSVTPGTAARSVNRTIYGDRTRLDEIYNLILSGYSGLMLNITFDASYNVCDMLCGGTIPPHLALSATVETISMRIGDGVVNDELRSLNQTAHALLQAVQHTAHLLSSAQERERRDSDVAPKKLGTGGAHG